MYCAAVTLGSNSDTLTTSLTAAVGTPEPYDLLGRFHATSRRELARYAGVVFDAAAAGSSAGARIVGDAATALAGQIVRSPSSSAWPARSPSAAAW